MNRLNKLFALAGIVAACLFANDSMAQNGGGGGGGGGGFGGGGGGGGGRRRGGGGNFDPAQLRQMQLDNAKTTLEVTDDSEWNVLSGAIGKVLDAQEALASATPRGGGFGRRNRNGVGGNGGGAGGGAGGGGAQAAGGGGGGGGQQGGGRFGTQSPEVQALRDAIDNNAPADEIKQKLAKVREVQKADQDKLDATRADLVKLLTPRQEASAVLMGLLK